MYYLFDTTVWEMVYYFYTTLTDSIITPFYDVSLSEVLLANIMSDDIIVNGRLAFKYSTSLLAQSISLEVSRLMYLLVDVCVSMMEKSQFAFTDGFSIILRLAC